MLLMGKLTISMAMFNSYLYVYQAGYHVLPSNMGETHHPLLVQDGPRGTKLWTLLYSVAWVGHRTDGPTERWFRQEPLVGFGSVGGP